LRREPSKVSNAAAHGNVRDRCAARRPEYLSARSVEAQIVHILHRRFTDEATELPLQGSAPHPAFRSEAADRPGASRVGF
jgi:hypothetical protein